MAAIDIPDAYWTIQPRRFVALVSNSAPAFQGVAADLALGAAPVVNGNDLALRQELASVDGDRDTIRADAAAEVNALATTPTGQAVAATATADGKIATGDNSSTAASQYQIPGVNIPAAPDLGTGDGAPIPGGTEPPPPDPNQGPPPAVAWITALYEELLGREPDGGGMSSWLAFMAAGHTIDEVRAGIIASPEYQQKHGAAPPPEAPPPAPPPPPEPPPIDTTAFVTHAQLAAVLDGFDPTINLWVS